jgi:hypothetical protein
MRRLSVILLLSLVLVACGAPESGAGAANPTAASVTLAAAAEPCAATDLQAYRAAYSDVYNRWGVALVAAGKVRPESLKSSIEQLQNISGELSKLNPPTCAQQANAETSQAMKQIIEGYQSLMAGKEVGQMLSHGIDMLSVARARVNALPEVLQATPTFVPTAAPAATNTPLATVTPTSTATATATPLPRNGVIDTKNAQIYETPSGTAPIKTLPRGTRVTVFELQKGRLHIKAGTVEGWVSQSVVVIK